MPSTPAGKLRDRLAYRLSTARGVPIEFELGPWKALVARIDAARARAPEDLLGAAAGLRAHPGRPDPEGFAVEALALASEAARRHLGLDPREGQSIAALGLLGGRVVQMDTGEGKTLAIALAAAVLALAEGGCHVLTANEYLAARDAAWMGPIYRALGLSAASVGQGDGEGARRSAYAADLTYLTARECGFDFLRDGLRTSCGARVQGDFRAAIVDEADFILIDEARIPLVIAGPSDLDPTEAIAADRIASTLAAGRDFSIDREGRRAALEPEGRRRVEEAVEEGRFPPLGAGEADRGVARVHAALVARQLLARDVDYLVRGGRVELVDGFTGRIADRRRWPWGVQAALEAKEGLAPGPEGMIYNTITVRHLAALYPRLAAATATAVGAAGEFKADYGLPTLVVPPARPCRRVDAPDLLFATAEAKRRAIVGEVERNHRLGRPVLVGTASVRESEELAAALAAAGVGARVLNARNDAEEAPIVAEAGRLGAVTISTNMAGRGTDIRLGGPGKDPRADEELRELERLGGLYVIGTNRHESRRVDDQLRGRAGRQGEPGESRFCVSLEDPLFRKYGVAAFLPKELLPGLREGPGAGEGPVGDPAAHREVERAQAIIEGENHRLRARLSARSLILEFERRHVAELRESALCDTIVPREVAGALPEGGDAELAARLFVGALDRFWAAHLEFAEDLREGIGLVRLGGRDPDAEYVRAVARAYEEGLEGLGGIVARALEEARQGSAAGVEAGRGAGPGAPGTTWTYQIDEEVLPGFALPGLEGVGAAALAAPFLVLLAALKRFFRLP